VTWVKRESEEDWKRNPTAGQAAGGLGFPKVPAFAGFRKPPPPPPAVIALPPKTKLPTKKVAAIAGSAGAFAAAAVAVGIKIAVAE